jgi:capsular polysaccharide transport system permease protein
MSTESEFPPALKTVQRPRRRFAAGRAIMALMLREMSTRYGASPGGYVWAVLEPLGAILMLTLAFSLILRSPPLGTSFVLFYATGFMPFSLYQSMAAVIGGTIIFFKQLLMYPTVTWVDAMIARLILNTVTGLMVAYILFTGILAYENTRALLDIEPILLSLFEAVLLGLSIGSVNCVLFGLFPVWQTVWSILTRPIFLASGIFFIYEDMPPLAQQIVWYNPLMHVTGGMRTGFYPMYTAEYVSHAYVLGFSVILLALGLILLGRFHRDVLNR